MCTSNTLNTLLNDFPVFYGKKNREDIPNEKNSSHTIDIFLGKKSFSIKENIPEDLTQSWPLGDKLSIENTSHQGSFSGLILGWGGEGLKRDLQ